MLGRGPEPGEAPPFKGIGSDGGHYSMLDLTRSTSLLIIFYMEDDKSMIQGLTELNKQTPQVESWLNMLGITNADAFNMKEWGDGKPGLLKSIGDDDRAIGLKYNIKSVPAAVLLSERGIMVKQWDNLSKDSVDQIKAELKKLHPDKAADIDVLKIPVATQQQDYLVPRR